MYERREQELLLEEVRDWIANMDYVCRSQEVMKLIRQLEIEHHAYLQLVVNVDEN
jgi:hypothetical protein